MRTTSDPVFGELSFQEVWIGNVSLPVVGEAELELYPNGSANDSAERAAVPSEAQREAYRRFTSWLVTGAVEPVFQRAVEYAVRKGREGFAMTEELPDVAPHWRDALDRPVVFVAADDDEYDLALQWNCDYTGDHGVEVVFKGGEPLGFGFAGDGDPEELL